MTYEEIETNIKKISSEARTASKTRKRELDAEMAKQKKRLYDEHIRPKPQPRPQPEPTPDELLLKALGEKIESESITQSELIKYLKLQKKLRGD